ncbi:helix-turn-helix transcriptional regulator [Streptomyces violascens]|uniref:helix-turn-helix transcriptional regulator n=1 Tax=Streptomyces violascens TaxID=67381 RepID=UPI0036BE4AA2
MMPKLLDAVSELLELPSELPPPQTRGRLRKAHRLTQQQVADRLGVRRLAVARWEAGEAEPRAPHREAYVQLLQELAARYPEVASTPADSKDLK